MARSGAVAGDFRFAQWLRRESDLRRIGDFSNSYGCFFVHLLDSKSFKSMTDLIPKTHNTMKTQLALLLVAVTLLVTSCSKSPKLGGDWSYNGQPCHVLQNGSNLTFINERGDKSGGTLIAKQSQVIALDWEGGLQGDLADNASRIDWRNGTVWIKQP
jgi:hypothetical protein